MITHEPTGRHYVGKTAKPRERWLQHRRGAAVRDSYIQRSIAKYGAEQFTFTELEWFDSEADAYEAERWWVAFLGSNRFGVGFNLSLGGEGNAGHVMSADARQRISESSKRRWARPGERERNGELAKRIHTGLKRSAATCARIGESIRGHETTAAHREKLRLAQLGKPKPGTSEKMRGRPKSQEHREKIGAAHRGMKRSEQARANMREAARRRREREHSAREEQGGGAQLVLLKV